MPAAAKGDGAIWVEWDGDGSPEDEPLVVCAACNERNAQRTKRLDATLGDVLLGLLLNAGEPLEAAGERVIAGHEYFGEGDLAAFIEQVSRLAQVLDQRGLG